MSYSVPSGGLRRSLEQTSGAWNPARRRVYLAFLLPAVLVLVVVTVFPFLYLFFTSLTPYELTKPASLHLEGLGNYQQLIQDDRFFNSLWVQVRLSVATV